MKSWKWVAIAIFIVVVAFAILNAFVSFMFALSVGSIAAVIAILLVISMKVDNWIKRKSKPNNKK